MKRAQKNNDKIEQAVDGEALRWITKGFSTFGVPIILGFLIWITVTTQDALIRLTRIETTLMNEGGLYTAQDAARDMKVYETKDAATNKRMDEIFARIIRLEGR